MTVMLGRAMVCYHKLSVQTAVVSGTVWPQFVMQVLTVGCKPLVWGILGGGSPSRLQVTSYRLLIVTIWAYLSPFSQCFDLSRKDRRTDGRTVD